MTVSLRYPYRTLYLPVRAIALATHPAGRDDAHSQESHGLQEPAPVRAVGLNREPIGPKIHGGLDPSTSERLNFWVFGSHVPPGYYRRW